MFSLITVIMLSAQAAPPCEKLAALTLPNTTIASAQLVPAGPFTPPPPQGPPGGPVAGPAPGAAAGRGAPAGGRGQIGQPAAPVLPAHCRVAACSSRPPIRRSRWRCGCPPRLERQVPGGRQRRLGGHDQLSRRWRARCRKATRRRPPTPGTRAATRSFAIGHPEKLIDFAYRAVHEMTVQAKALITLLLQPAGAAVVLERLLDRRTPGADVGAAVSGGFRRDPRRRAGQLPDAPARLGSVRWRCRC